MIRIRIQIQGFYDEKMKKIEFFKPKIAIYLSLGCKKDVQATGDAFSPQKRTSSPSKHEIFNFFLFLWNIFALRDPDSEPADQN
jgi:hypothetical protein